VGLAGQKAFVACFFIADMPTRRSFLAGSAGVLTGCLGGNDNSLEESAGLQELVVYWVVTDPPEDVPVTHIDEIDNETVVEVVEEADEYLDDEENREELETAAEPDDNVVTVRSVGRSFDNNEQFRSVEETLNSLLRLNDEHGFLIPQDGPLIESKMGNLYVVNT